MKKLFLHLSKQQNMSEILSITKENVLKAYNDGSEGDRALLSRLFPGKLEKKPILERVNTLEEACVDLGLDIANIFADCEDEYERAETAIKIFAKALREGKPPKDCFYYPYFYKSGGGFSYDGYVDDCGCTAVGARLRVDSAEKAKHLGQKMESYYKTYCLGE